MTKCKFEFDFIYPAYASITPVSPFIPQNRKEEKEFWEAERRKSLYRVKYPEWCLQEVINADIIDLRERGINVTDAYSGTIRVQLTELSPGGSIKVGSRRDRERHALQWQYQFPKQEGIRKEMIDVWSGMPYAKFKVTMNIEMDDEKQKSLIKVSESINKLSSDDLAETRIDKLLGSVQIASNLTEEDLEALTGDPELKDIESWMQLGEVFQNEMGIDFLTAFRTLLSDPKNKIYGSFKTFIAKRVAANLPQEWGRTLLDMRQELLEEKEFAKKRKNYKLKREVNHILELIENADDIAKDIFEIFRFYMNTHLACVKYRHNQFWITPIPEWASDSFYLRTKVIMDDKFPIVTFPIYSIGTLVKLKRGGSDNIGRDGWLETTSLSIRRQVGYESGFSTEGIFVKAFEALEEGECEVCVILLKIGLAFGFKLITKGIVDPEEIDLKEKMSIPDAQGEFSKVMPNWMDIFKNYAKELGITLNEVDQIKENLEYLNILRNAVEHNKTIVRSYIERAQAGDVGFTTPESRKVSTPIKSNHKKAKPYHWRVVNDLYNSARLVFTWCILFKTQFFPNSIEV